MEHLPDIIFHPLAIPLALLVLIVIICCVGMYNYWILRGMNIPGARPLPYIGNLQDFSKYEGVHLCILAYMKKYGKVFSLCTGRKTSIVIADPELLKQIMVKDFHNFTNRVSIIPPNAKQKGLLQLRDGEWRRVRSVLTPVFTSGKLKMMIPAIEKSCKTLVGKLKGIADTGKSVDMFYWFGRMTLEVILSTAFGIESSVQNESADSKFLITAREVMKRPTVTRLLMMLPLSNLWIRIMMYDKAKWMK